MIFAPLNTSDVSKLLSFGLGKAGVDANIVGLVDKVQEMIGTAAPIGRGALSEIATIEAGSDGLLFKPPTLILRGTDGSSTEVGVVASRLSINSSPENRTARDRFIAAARQQLAQ